MECLEVHEVRPGETQWPPVAALFPRTVAWQDDPDDHGNYHFFAAVAPAEEFVGGAVIDIGPLGFGPLAGMTIGFLEDIEVLVHRRHQGIGNALLCRVLAFAWERGAESVRWTVDWENRAAIELYRKVGAAFIPEGDDRAHAERCYTVVVARPR